MTRTTLIPMDFTSISINALRFAMDCFPDDDFAILHVRSHTMQTDDPVPVGAMETTVDFWKESFTLFVKKEMNWSTWPANVRLDCVQGSVVGEILNASKEGVKQIVMGTRDKYSHLEKWLGTNSLGVVRKSDVPVYLIPRYAKGVPFGRVLVASDDHFREDWVVEMIAKWNNPFKAFLHFIHVAKEVSDSYIQEQKSIVRNLFEKHDPTFGFEVSVIADSDVSGSLLGKAYSSHADLLLILPHKRSYIESLLFKSISKDLILRSEIPLLFMPS